MLQVSPGRCEKVTRAPTGGSANKTLLPVPFHRGFTFWISRDKGRLMCAVRCDVGIWPRFFGLSSSFPRKGWDQLHAGTCLALPSYPRALEGFTLQAGRVLELGLSIFLRVLLGTVFQGP